MRALLLTMAFLASFAVEGQFKLVRVHKPKMTVGVLTKGTTIVASVVERPWDDNKMFISAIPEGTYIIKFKFYGKYHEKWKYREGYKGVPVLTGVPGRSEILFHPAKSVADVKGCLGVLSPFWWSTYEQIKEGDTIKITSK